MGIIYSATNLVNDKIYIGKTKYSLEYRIKKHNSSNHKSYFHNAIHKYGSKNFEWDIIDSHEDERVLNQLERLHISRYESNQNHSGYNLTEGGDGLPNPTEETRKKMSKAATGRKHTIKTKEKISQNNANLGKKRSKEISKKMSIGRRRNKFPGASYDPRRCNPWKRVWVSKISYNGKQKNLGTFEDPISASIVYQLVWDELYP